jgi:predicted O-methyltransferase YrrM
VLATGPRTILELGTSAGYSTIWLASAARRTGGRIVTVDTDPAKIEWARSNLIRAGLADLVEFVHGDAESTIEQSAERFEIVFMDHGSSRYVSAFEILAPRLETGAIVVADGWATMERWNDDPEMFRYKTLVMQDSRFRSFLLPVEKGTMISIRL